MTMESESNGQLYLWHGRCFLAPSLAPRHSKTFEESILSLEDDLYDQRIQRIAEIEALGFQPYGHRFDFTHTIPQILAEYAGKTAEQLAEPRVQVRVAGRVTTMR